MQEHMIALGITNIGKFIQFLFFILRIIPWNCAHDFCDLSNALKSDCKNIIFGITVLIQ